MSVKIEKGIDPPKFQEKGRPKIFDFNTMEVGDSILYKKTLISNANSWAVRNKKPWKFVSRREGEGYRLWRVV